MMTPEKQEYIDMVRQYTRSKFPSLPEHAIPKPKTAFNNANALTAGILKTFEACGLYATRVQSQGQYDPQLKIFRKGTTKRGVADVMGIVNGRHVSVEVKYAKDRMSDAQKKTAQQVQASGGIYFVARDFESFWRWFNELKQEGGSNE